MAEVVRSGRFVVLEHDRNGVHWDFMLEAGDGLRTWSMNAPPAPGQDQPARALADHRLVYLSYEGPVSGGRGRVRRVAEGKFQTLEWDSGHVRIKLTGDQLVGEVDLSCSGPDCTAGSTWSFRLGKVD
jgi:DNA polymerase Ligase (LigD)